jgi:hypothetical protein
MYLQSALGWSPTSAGLSLIILMLTLNSTAGLSSQLLGRVQRYKLLPLCFLCVGLGAVVALAVSADNMTSFRFRDHLAADRHRLGTNGAVDTGRAAKHRAGA